MLELDFDDLMYLWFEVLGCSWLDLKSNDDKMDTRVTLKYMFDKSYAHIPGLSLVNVMEGASLNNTMDIVNYQEGYHMNLDPFVYKFIINTNRAI